MNKIIILFIIILSYCELSSSFNIRNYINDLDRAVNKACNRKALTITNNSDMYNCLKVNTSNNCMHIENFSSYIKEKDICKYFSTNIKEKDICTVNCESYLGKGILIAIFGWVFLMLLCQK